MTLSEPNFATKMAATCAVDAETFPEAVFVGEIRMALRQQTATAWDHSMGPQLAGLCGTHERSRSCNGWYGHHGYQGGAKTDRSAVLFPSDL